MAAYTPESTMPCSQETPNSLPACITHHLVPFSTASLCISNMHSTIHCLLITHSSLVTSSVLSHEHTRTYAHMAYVLLSQLIQLAQAHPHDAMYLPSMHNASPAWQGEGVTSDLLLPSFLPVEAMYKPKNGWVTQQTGVGGSWNWDLYCGSGQWGNSWPIHDIHDMFSCLFSVELTHESHVTFGPGKIKSLPQDSSWMSNYTAKNATS